MSLLAAFTECESPGQHSQVAYRPDSTYLAHERANPDICRISGNGEASQRAATGAVRSQPEAKSGCRQVGQECCEGRKDYRAVVRCVQASTQDVVGLRTTMDRTAGTRTRYSGSPGSKEAWARSGAWPPRAQTGKARYLSALH